jgi:chitodextrinase
VDTIPPSAPTNLTANAVSTSQINLSWTASTDNVGVTGYFVERCQGAGCTTFTQVASVTGTVTTYSDTGLASNTTFTYRVRATDAAGNLSPYSNVASATTQAPQPPTAPTNLTATAASASQINLSWTASTSNAGIANYLIWQCQGVSCVNFAQIASVAGTVTIYSNIGLTANTTYTYEVIAIDTLNNLSAPSNIAGATTQAQQPPTAPSGLTATAISGTQINLAWTASTSNVGLAHYLVERCQGAGCTTFAQIASTAPTSLTYNDTGLTASTTYSYRVRAIDTLNNNSPYSNVATATSLSAVTGLTAAYSFDENTGTTAGDSSGNALTGTLVGAAWNGLGKYASALSFDGSASYVDLGNPALLHLTSSMTLEAWVYPTNVPVDDGQIIAKSDTPVGTEGFELKTTPDTGFRTFGVGVSPSGSTHIQRYSVTQPVLNTWYHVAGVYNAAAQTLDIYVNGVLDDGVLNGVVPSSQFDPPVNVNIGKRGSGWYFGGLIDEVRVYSRALSQVEIQNDMNTPLTPGVVPAVTLSTTSLSFGNQGVSTASSPQSITITNTGNGPLVVGSVSFTGSTGINYVQNDNCGTVAVGANCTINVTFRPSVTGTLQATLSIADNAPGNPHLVAVTGTGVAAAFSISPRTSTLTSTLTQQFTATGGGVTWSVDGTAGGSAAFGTITNTGLYTPPAAAGVHTVSASTTSPPQAASATVYVTNYAGSYTRDVDTFRSGLNPNEIVLTPANVNVAQFGKIASYSIDGIADASPLYVAGVSIPGNGVHNVVYVATEHDSVYAFDADGRQLAPLWHDSFINPANGVTTVPPIDTGECCDISPEIGITGSPVIDPTTNTLYVVVKTKEVSGATNYFSRLHALDLATGAEKFGGPVTIQASVPGSGAGSSGGIVPFTGLHENQRAALLLANGVVYIAYAGHGDNFPYHGWILGYNASTLQQVMVFNTSPNDAGLRPGGGGQGSGVWQSGDGLTVDPAGNLFFVTGNGLFDVNTGGVDYGDSFMKLSPSGAVLDYFTPFDQASMNVNDIDLGSGGTLLLPDQPGAHPHLALTAGKNGTIYLIDRDNAGHYNANNNNQIVQSLVNIFPNGSKITGNFKAPVFWNNNVYYSADQDFVKRFTLSNGLLSTTPTSQGSFVFNYPGGTLQMSANGSTNPILWAIQRVDLDPFGSGVKGPGALHAFDATNLANELYNSNQASASRDTLDFAVKWSAPLVANGRVYVATESLLSIFGLLP